MNRILIAVLLSLIASSGIFAQPFPPPWVIPYQARFENAQGTPMPAGQYDLIFGLWDSEFGGGPPFWSEAQQVNVDQDGLFEVCLGQFVALDPAAWPANNQIWLALGYNEEFLAPRVPFKAVPFAFHADNVLKFDNMEPDEFRQSVVDYAEPRFVLDGAYTRNLNNLAIDANQTVSVLSDLYFLPYNSYVKYYALTGAQPAPEGFLEEGLGTVRVELLDESNQIWASSMTTGAANPGSPAIYAITTGEVPAGWYRTRAYFSNSEYVAYQGWELGASWQGEAAR